MKITLLFIFQFAISFYGLIHAQSLTGHLLHAATDQSIESANVFIAHTSQGTLTDENGNFEIKNIPTTSFELVISHVGFETLIRKIDPTKSSNLTIQLRLSPNTVNLTEVSVTSIKESKRKRYFKRFESAFLGSSPNAEKCTILNPEVLFYKLTNNKLDVKANDLIQIENQATGYKIYFLLEAFSQEADRTQFAGKPLFDFLKPKEDKQKTQWIKQRKKTYLGSQQHFYKSLYNGNLNRDGFLIYHARLKNNSEFETLAPAQHQHILKTITEENKQLLLNDFIKIVYTKYELTKGRGLSRMDAASKIGRPAEAGMVTQERNNVSRKGNHPTSYLFARKSRIPFQKNGLPERPDLLIAYGYWSTKGVADLLPIDYKVEDENLVHSHVPSQSQKSSNSDPVINGFILNNLLIPLDEIKKGGPPRDGIPSIDAPQFTTAEYAQFISPEEEVLGVVVNGKAKAYPIKIMDRHEIVNDKFNGTPAVVSYCPLCGSGMTFSALVNDERKTFGVSGLLYNSDVLLYDRETESLWSQIKMQAVSGKASGQKLDLIATTQTTWQDWSERYPNTLILTTKTGYGFDYDQQAYAKYRTNSRLMFPVNKESKKLAKKDKVIGVEINGQYKAYPLKTLRKATSPIKDQLNGNTLLIHYNKEADSAYITNKKGEVIPATTLYWFAWYAFHPETAIFEL